MIFFLDPQFSELKFCGPTISERSHDTGGNAALFLGWGFRVLGFRVLKIYRHFLSFLVLRHPKLSSKDRL